MKKIPLTQGKLALVDDEDFERLNAHKWCAARNGKRWYAQRYRPVVEGGGIIRMHREIAGVLGMDADHKNGDGLDNRRENLRMATHSQNMAAFRRPTVRKTSQFRGVSWHSPLTKWLAGIKVCGKSHYLGYFSSEEDAARAYDAAARKLFGEFASPNFL